MCTGVAFRALLAISREDAIYSGSLCLRGAGSTLAVADSSGAEGGSVSPRVQISRTRFEPAAFCDGQKVRGSGNGAGSAAEAGGGSEVIAPG